MELSKVTSAAQARIWAKHLTQLVESAPDERRNRKLTDFRGFHRLAILRGSAKIRAWVQSAADGGSV